MGIGGKLERIDCLFVAGAAGIISAETGDVGAGCSDHKGVRVVGEAISGSVLATWQHPSADR